MEIFYCTQYHITHTKSPIPFPSYKTYQYTTKKIQPTYLPPPQIPHKRRPINRIRIRRRHLRPPGLRHGMSQVHRSTNILIHLQIARDEREGTHVVPRPPGGSVRFQTIYWVFVHLVQGLAEDGEVFFGDLRVGSFIEPGGGVFDGLF